MFKSNLIRVTLGFFGGYFLNSVILGLEISVLLFTVIQWAFFIIFYEIVDRVIIKENSAVDKVLALWKDT